MFVIGYKGFNKDFTNRYGDKFEIGKIYHADSEIKWGNKGNGFHLCTNIEDCFRYVDPNNLLMTELLGLAKCENMMMSIMDITTCMCVNICELLERFLEKRLLI